MKTILNQYNAFTSSNNHNAATMVLVERFGSKEEKETLSNIIEVHEKRGYILPNEQVYRDGLQRKYLQTIR